jgi:hypothetical protein
VDDVKAKLVDFDRAGMLKLVQDLYAASKDNQNFLHARFELGNDVLEPYKAIIERWACPDIDRNQDYSVAKAKKSIADYRKAIGRPQGLAELTVFYCEQAIGFNVKVAPATHEPPLARWWERARGARWGIRGAWLRAHRAIPACKPECALQGRETVMAFIIRGVLPSHDR